MKTLARHIRFSLGLAGWAALIVAAGAAETARPPNILFIQADSWDGRALGFLGHPGMKRATPNLDRLARRGVALKNTYTVSPICVCSRAAMWSGQDLWHCEAWNNFKGLEPGTTTAFTQLSGAGYTLARPEGGFGKMDYTSGSHSLMNRIAAWTAPAGIALPVIPNEEVEIRPDDGAHINSRQANTDVKSVTQGREFLRAHAHDAKPFFLYVSLNIPHAPFITNQRYLGMIDQDEITLPPEDKELHPAMRYQQITKDWPHGFTPEVVRRTRAIYYAMCAESDAMVGELLAELEQQGLADNTYVVFTGDHGENALEHHQWYKENMYESSARVPLIIAGPGIERGLVLDNIVSLVDIFPTLEDMARLPRVPALDGESLLPLVTGRTRQSRNWATAAYTDFTSDSTMFMLRQGDWKFVAYPGYGPQLFNLKNDPDESDNLAKSRPEVARELDAALRKIVDYDEVHRRVVAYDKASFSAWREQAKKGPVPNYDPTGAMIVGKDGKPVLLTYEQAMKSVYRGWSPAAESQLEQWLAKK